MLIIRELEWPYTNHFFTFNSSKLIHCQQRTENKEVLTVWNFRLGWDREIKFSLCSYHSAVSKNVIHGSLRFNLVELPRNLQVSGRRKVSPYIKRYLFNFLKNISSIFYLFVYNKNLIVVILIKSCDYGCSCLFKRKNTLCVENCHFVVILHHSYSYKSRKLTHKAYRAIVMLGCTGLRLVEDWWIVYRLCLLLTGHKDN